MGEEGEGTFLFGQEYLTCIYNYCNLNPPRPTPTHTHQNEDDINISFEAAPSSNSSGNTSIDYVLQFSRSPLVAFSRLRFVDSPGIIGFDEVEVVSIENCSFR